jgi:hypothetical protein
VAYPDFTVSEAARRFLLTVDETTDIFAPVIEVAPSDLLQTQGDIATYYLDSLPAILGNLLRIVR